MSASLMAQEIRPLPTPQWTKKEMKKGLPEVLRQRRSERVFTAQPLSDMELSKLLWAACGVNRPKEGKITAPSAINGQDILVFVCDASGAWRYEAAAHRLVKVSDKDLRPDVAGRQEFASKAPVCLVLVSDISKVLKHRELGAMDAGYVSENICLACTAMELKTVPRASMNHAVLAKELGLTDTQIPMLNHPVGR